MQLVRCIAVDLLEPAIARTNRRGNRNAPGQAGLMHGHLLAYRFAMTPRMTEAGCPTMPDVSDTLSMGFPRSMANLRDGKRTGFYIHVNKSRGS